MFNLLLNGGGNASSIIMLIVLGVLIVLMLVLPTINQNKRVKAYQEMQSGLKAGDKVQTVGGIIGRIVKINEKDGIKTMILETGDKNNKMHIEFNLDAIAGVVTNGETSAIASAKTEETENTTEEKPEETEATVVDVDFEKQPEENSNKAKQTSKKPSTKKKN